MKKSLWKPLGFNLLCLLVVFTGVKLYTRKQPGQTQHSTSPDTSKDIQPIEVSRIRGLETINVDRWTLGLSSTVKASLSKNALDTILHHYDETLHLPDSRWLENFFNTLVQTLATTYISREDYMGLAQALTDARDQIRSHGPVERSRIAIHLLSILTDETLYAMSLKFPSLNPTWEWHSHNTNNISGCEIKYSNTSLCEGDLVLSKSDAFSGLLFLFHSPYSSTYSHVALASGTSQNAKLIGADLPGLITSPITSLDSMPRIGIYRSKGSLKNQKQVLNAILQTHTINFNFDLKPECSPKKYFCSELFYCFYKDLGIEGDSNPYPERIWTLPGSKEGEAMREFVTALGKSRWEKIPSPGDVEFNPEFESLAQFIRVPLLSNLRIQTAIVNSFIQILHDDPKMRDAYVKSIIKAEAGMESLLPKEARQDYKRLRLALARQVTPAELAFYAHFQFTLLPQTFNEILSLTRGRLALLSELESRSRQSIQGRMQTFITQY